MKTQTAIAAFSAGITPWLESIAIDEAIASFTVRDPNAAAAIDRQRCAISGGVVALANSSGAIIARYNWGTALTA